MTIGNTKKPGRVVVSFIALLACLALLACGPDGPAGGGGGLETRSLVIAGTFNRGGGEAKFSASTNPDDFRSVSRAIGSDEYELTGLLEDGDITFRLKGNYNSQTKTYTLSAAAEFLGLRYTLTGKFKDNGTAETGKAVVQVRTGSGDSAVWNTTEVPVTASESAIEIEAPAENIIDDTPGGIPVGWRGIWRDQTDASYYAMVNAFSVVIYEKVDGYWVEAVDDMDQPMTMYFTDIQEEGSGYSGITGYMGWDIEALPDNWSQLMYADYAEENNLRLMDWPEVYNMYHAEFSMTSTGKTIINKYPNLVRQYSFYTPYKNGELMDAHPYYYDHFYPWFQEKHYHGYYMDPPFDAPGYEYLTEYFDLLTEYRNGDGKTQGDLIGAIIGISVYPPDYGDGWEFSDPDYLAFQNEFGNTLNNWLEGQGFINSLILPYWFQDEWLERKYGKNYPYWRQWYMKMSLKIENGKLIPGQYVKDSVGGHWDGLCWEADDWNIDIPPVWAVKTYGQVKTVLTTPKWESYGLSR